MSIDEQIYLTRAGYKRLQRELDILLTEETREVAAQIAEIREAGDFSQEQIYFDALAEKDMLEGRIARLQSILQRATVIEKQLDPDSVTPGDRVTVRDLDEKETLVLDIISGVEMAAGRRGVTLGSPVGRAILGKRVGEKFEVTVPAGVSRYKVLNIEPIPDEE